MNIDSRTAAAATIAMLVTFVLAELLATSRSLFHAVGLGFPLLQLGTSYLFWRKGRVGWLFAIVAVPAALGALVYLLQYLPEAVIGVLMPVIVTMGGLNGVIHLGYVALTVHVGIFVVAVMIPPLPIRERNTVPRL